MLKKIAENKKLVGPLSPYFLGIVLAGMTLIVSPETVFCQTDAGVVEKSLRQSRPQYQPPIPEVVPDIQIEDSRELVDAGEGPSFFVREIKVVGNTLISTEELAPLIDVGQGDEMTLGILTLHANEVTAAYAAKGYFLTKAFIPAQELTNGVVTLQVVEGKLGTITVDGAKMIPSEQFLDRMISLRDEEVLNESALERVLLELNSLLGVDVKSVLRPGELTGTTDMVLQVKETRAFKFSLDVDNFGSEFTGRIRVGTSATMANFFKLGDQFSIRFVKSDKGQTYVQPSFLFPINGRGTTLKASFSYSEHSLKSSLASRSGGGSSQIFSLEASHPLKRSRSSNMFVKAGLEHREYINELFGVNTSDDRLLNFYLGVSGNATDRLGRNFYSAQVKSGFTESGIDEPLNSREGGQGDVTIFSTSLVRYQSASHLNKKMPGYFTFKAGGQLATARVLSPDQTSIGGFGTVRGYPLAEFSGDNGYTFSMEYNYPFPFKMPNYGTPVINTVNNLFIFFDHGKVFINSPNAGESEQSISGAGFGFNITRPAKDKSSLATTFSLQYAIPVMDGPDPSDRSFGIIYLSGLVTY